MKKLKMKRIICTILTIAGISLGITGCTSSSKSTYRDNINEVDVLDNAPFEITFMNVGKADCILIEVEDKAIMIDTGLNSTKDEISSALQEKGINTLEYLVLSHMDKDHIGGADTVLNKFKVNNIIQADYIKDSKQYNQYAEALEENNMSPILLHENINFKINDAEINIYPALKYVYSKSNDYSIIVGITYGEYNFLFAGDAEEERLAEFISENTKKYTVVKIPHHGRINNLSEEFLKSVSPAYSIITCSEEDKPDEQMLNLLDKYNIKTFLTSDGDIVVKTDGNKINITTD